MLPVRERGGRAARRGGADPAPRAPNVPGGPGPGRERNPGAGPGKLCQIKKKKKNPRDFEINFVLQ